MQAARNCEHVCQIHGLADVHGKLAVVMDLYDSSLAQVIGREHPEGFPLARALPLLAQVANGIRELHKIRLVHANLKPENVLFDRRTGSAAVSDPLSSRGGRGLAVLYAAPEQLEGKQAGPKADVWALALVAIYALVGHTAYEPGIALFQVMGQLCAEKHPPKVQILVVQGSPPLSLQRVGCRARCPAALPPLVCFDQVPASIRSSSPDLAALLESMLSIDPAQRPTAEQVHGMLRAFVDKAGVSNWLLDWLPE